MADLRVLFLSLFVLVCNSVAEADTIDIREAYRYFELRAENARECIADPSNIDRSIYHFKKVVDDQAKPDADAVEGLLKAYEFKGVRTDVSQDEKIRIFEKGIDLGEKMMKMYPEHSGIKYWYMANLGRWAQEVGVMKAARAHVASEVKEIAEWLIENDPLYDEAGPYRVLGTMNMELPRIPFVLSWPSDSDGLALLKKAYELAPQHYGNSLRYARALIKEGHEDKARTLLTAIEDSSPRKATYLEDLDNLNEARKLLATLM